MSDFAIVSKAIENRFNSMAESQLYVVDVNKDALWDLYLNSFPKGMNEIHIAKREYDCNHCKNFFRAVGNVVIINKQDDIETIWDVTVPYPFNEVFQKLSEFVKNSEINSIFYRERNEWKVSVPYNIKLTSDGNRVKYNHLYCEIPEIYRAESVRGKQGKIETDVSALKRRLDEYEVSTINTVLEIIDGGLYRGQEKKKLVNDFKQLLIQYKKLLSDKERNIFVWKNFKNIFIVNDVIETLFKDIQSGINYDDACDNYGKLVDPTKYRRSNSIVTPRMKEQAIQTIKDLGLERSIFRRLATIHDIPASKVIFADRDIKKKLKGGDLLNEISNLFDTQIRSNSPAVKMNNIDEIDIDDFIKNLIPKISKMSVFFQNRHSKNLMSLTGPKNENSGRLFSWNNEFAWSYNGGTTDSIIKQRVKAEGGEINARFRCSLAWSNEDDLDLRLIEPNNNIIYFRNKRSGYFTLDIDRNAHWPLIRNAVENIFGNDAQHGWHKIQVNNFNQRERVDIGFSVECEFDNIITNYKYDSIIDNGETIDIVKFFYDKKLDSITQIQKLNSELKEESISTNLWGINTETFIPVKLLMNSPNHWEENIGNKHWFFILDDCKMDQPIRGFFNEYLTNDLIPHRKAFEILADLTKCEVSDEQLSGIGFSSTLKDNLVIKIEGDGFNKLIKVNFNQPSI